MQSALASAKRVRICEATIEKKPIVEKLYQLYLYDFSEFDGADVNEDGLFRYKYLDLYWQEDSRYPFIIEVDSNIAGFVLVRRHSILGRGQLTHTIAEFFVMRKYRRQGVGRAVAFAIFDRFLGSWEVHQTPENIPAQKFWRKVISEYTDGRYFEVTEGTPECKGPIQYFDNWEVRRGRSKNMEFSIREAVLEDYEGLCEVFEEVDALHREALPYVFREPDGPARTREYISGIIASRNATLFVAEHDGQIIGLVHATLLKSPDIPIIAPRRYAVIENLAVTERFRRSGVGRSLVERVHQWVLDKGITQVELNVWEFNKGAIAFYEQLGYTTVSRKMWKSLG
ncbi:MAG: GNAT family N-acetyltransferase [Candidatus Poribacteria bacterium]